MAEPGAPISSLAPVATQGNTQGDYSKTHYNAFIPTGGISGGTSVNPTNGGVGFGDKGVTDSKEGTGDKGEHDEVRDDEFTNDSKGIQEESVSSASVPESPFVRYVQRNLSDGNEQKTQKYYNQREMGRGTNKGDIRKAYYFGMNEADIFTWGMSSGEPTNREEIEKSEYPKYRDV